MIKPAYIITNEDLRAQIASQASTPQQDILTVAASGDQAMFYSINGAHRIDTFDITPLAGVIQEIKTTALGVLNREEYIKLLQELRNCPKITECKNMDKIMPRLSAASRAHILNNNCGRIFFNYNSVNDYTENLPTAAEYAKMQQTITKPFNFIHTDLYNLHAHLNTQYDIINISNILDYCYNATEQSKIIQHMYQHLKIGGRMLYPAQLPKYKYELITMKNKTGETLLKCDKILNKLYVFQRIR